MALSSGGAQGTGILQGVIWHLPQPRPNHPIPTFLPWACTCHLEHRILSLKGSLAPLWPCQLAVARHPCLAVWQGGGVLELGAGYLPKLPESLLPCWGLSERALSLGKHRTLGVDFQNGGDPGGDEEMQIASPINWAADCS